MSEQSYAIAEALLEMLPAEFSEPVTDEEFAFRMKDNNHDISIEDVDFWAN